MEEEVDKTLERNRKNEYYNTLKLFCLGDSMLVVMFLWFDCGIKKLQEHMKKTSKREYAHTNQQVTTHQHKKIGRKGR
jgi:phosphoserine aminotransferase